MSHGMTPMLADISPGEWLMLAVTVGLFIVALIGLLKKTDVNVSPQPLQIELQKQFADKHEFDKHVMQNKTDHDQIFSKIGGVDRGNSKKLEDQIQILRSERHADAVETHRRINEMEKSVGGLESATELQNQSLAALQSDVKRILERLPR